MRRARLRLPGDESLRGGAEQRDGIGDGRVHVPLPQVVRRAAAIKRNQSNCLVLAAALSQLRAHEVERTRRLPQREQVLGPPVALQALGDLLGTDAHAHVLHRAQHLAAAMTLRST